MSKFNRIESIEKTTQSQAFRNIPENTSEPLLEMLENNKNSISTFREDVKNIIKMLHIPNPGFVSQLKKYLKDKEKDHKDTISINEYVKRADIIDFQETLDNWDTIEDYELKEQMIELSKSCSLILDLLEEEHGEEAIKTKKAKRHQDHEIERYRDESDDEERELYEKYGYAA
ncbi:MAG: hypothetical protein WCO66_03390 [Candidatus Absconditabacteria bacterium]